MTKRETYWVDRNDIKLAVYRKRPASSAAPIVFLVHGSSVAALPSFDLHVPGKPDYSFMDYLVGHGFDVWTMDHENYGASDRTKGFSDIAAGVQDLLCAAELVRKETGCDSWVWYGQSAGALRVGALANTKPDVCKAICLEALVWTGAGSPTLQDRSKKLDQWRANNMRPFNAELVRSMFERDQTGLADPAVGDAIIEASRPYGDMIPTGTYIDMSANLPLVEPEKIDCPVLILRSEHDGLAAIEDVLAFYTKLASRDKTMQILSKLTHVGTAGLHRHKILKAFRAFLQSIPNT